MPRRCRQQAAACLLRAGESRISPRPPAQCQRSFLESARGLPSFAGRLIVSAFPTGARGELCLIVCASRPVGSAFSAVESSPRQSVAVRERSPHESCSRTARRRARRCGKRYVPTLGRGEAAGRHDQERAPSGHRSSAVLRQREMPSKRGGRSRRGPDAPPCTQHEPKARASTGISVAVGEDAGAALDRAPEVLPVRERASGLRPRLRRPVRRCAYGRNPGAIPPSTAAERGGETPSTGRHGGQPLRCDAEACARASGQPTCPGAVNPRAEPSHRGGPANPEGGRRSAP